MAKNFGSAGSAKTFGQVAKKEQVKATVLALKNITDDVLEDDPENKEDISYTADIESSIQQIGFSDPLEVTDFGMPEGHYRIVSGHRRRAAGRKVGMTVFPCIVRHYDNKDDLDNYRLLSNLHRDSARDPLLFARRYALHKDYLEHIGFKGSKREEIAKRLGGISLATLDRYANMNKIIQPVWELIAAEKTMVTSVQMLASHTPEEQNEIYDMMKAELEKKDTLSGADVRRIVDIYRHPGESFDEESKPEENIEVSEKRDSGLPLMGEWVNDEPMEKKEHEYYRADEFRHDFDPIAAEYDAMDRDKESWKKQQAEKKAEEVDEKQKKINELLKSLKKLNTQLEEGCPSCNKEDAEAIMEGLYTVADRVLNVMHDMCIDYRLDITYDEKMADIRDTIDAYREM